MVSSNVGGGGLFLIAIGTKGGAWVLPTVEATTGAAAAAATVAPSLVWSQAWEAGKALDVRYFVAGGTCAAISHGITTPIDVVKTKLQAQPLRFQNMNVPQAAMEIIKTDGAPALLGGLGPTVLGYGNKGAKKFGIYEVMKPIFAALFQGSSNGVVDGNNSNNGVAFLLDSVSWDCCCLVSVPWNLLAFVW